MSFPRYPEYKDSGVEWLGTVPAHWNVNRLKRLARLLTEKTDRREKPVALENIESWSGSFVETEAMFSGEGVGFEPGDILFGKLRPYLAKVLLAAFSGEAVGDFHVLHPASSVHGRFLQFQLLNADFISLVDGSTYGAKMPRASWDFMGNVALAAPPLSEQTAIAAFLDRETAKIDALVAEQETLIALLKEKRQAVISHAVTKGLNPDAPMKPSGIEWLGDVPAHWDLPPLFLRYSVELGKMLDTNKISGQHLSAYLRNVDVQWDQINTDDLPAMDISPTEVERFTVRNGDLLVCEGGEVGRAAVVKDLAEPIGYQKALHRLRQLTPNEFPRFLFFVFRWATATGVFSGEGQSTIAHLTGEQLRKYRFPKPPLEEQVSIASFLDAEAARLDELLAEAQHAITLLKERRSALISAAVTGQIDVRGLAPA